MSEQVTFGAELRRLRLAAGLSLTDLSGRIHYSKGYLSKVENGVARPNEALAAVCDREFSSGGTLLALVAQHKKPRRTTGAFGFGFSGLPPMTKHFTGRTDELTRIRAILTSDEPNAAGICAVDGMAGVGKTALALCAAWSVQRRFSDGCLFLDLRGFTRDAPKVSSADALDRFLRQLGVPGDEIPSDVDDRAGLYRDRLRGRRVLIVLDNARSAQQVIPLLPAEPTCRVLVTSRNRLTALDDAQHVSLSALPADAAVTLFRSVAAGRTATETEDELDGDLDDVVRRCGGLPLAVRIVAARYQGNPAWTLSELNDRLADEHAILSELDDGERSVAGSLQMSYQDIPADQRRCFGLLALHPGGDFDEYDAAALAGVPLGEARRLLDRLHEAHLMLRRAKNRYQFHDLLRSFAADVALREIADEDQDAAVRRLLDASLAALAEADHLLNPLRQHPDFALAVRRLTVRRLADHGAAMSWLTDAWPNLVAICRLAGESGADDRCWQLALCLRGFLYLNKLFDPWIDTHTLAVAAARRIGNRWAEGITLSNLGMAHAERGDSRSAAGWHAEALAVFREIGDETGIHDSLSNRGWMFYYQEKLDLALSDIRAALSYYERTDPRKTTIALAGLALIETELADYAAAEAHAKRSLELAEQHGLDVDCATALNNLGLTYFRSGEHTKAADAYREAVIRAEHCDSSFEIARAKTGLGNIAAAADNVEEAHRLWDEAEAHHPNLNETTARETRIRLASQFPKN